MMSNIASIYNSRYKLLNFSFPIAQIVEHGASNAKIMGSIPRESKSWYKCKKKKAVTWPLRNVSRFG